MMISAVTKRVYSVRCSTVGYKTGVTDRKPAVIVGRRAPTRFDGAGSRASPLLQGHRACSAGSSATWRIATDGGEACDAGSRGEPPVAPAAQLLELFQQVEGEGRPGQVDP